MLKKDIPEDIIVGMISLGVCGIIILIAYLVICNSVYTDCPYCGEKAGYVSEYIYQSNPEILQIDTIFYCEQCDEKFFISEKVEQRQNN